MSASTKVQQRASLPESERHARQKLIALGVPENIIREIADDESLTFFTVVRAIEQEATERNVTQSYAVEVMCRHHRGSSRGKMQIDRLLDKLRRTR